MLCDQLVKEGLCGGFDPKLVKAFTSKISKAHKFVLAPDFAQAADELGTDLRGIAKALPFCRLPYPMCWFEAAQSDRPNFVRGTSPGAHQGFPTRVGFLAEATKDDLSAWKLHLCWHLPHPNDYSSAGNYAAATGQQMDMAGGLAPVDAVEQESKIAELSPEERTQLGLGGPSLAWQEADRDTKTLISGIFKPLLPEYGIAHTQVDMGLALGINIKDLAKGIWVNNVQDWAGEIQYFTALLALFNARNASQTVLVDHTTYNKIRQKRGSLPLFSHHVLSIHPRQKARMQPVVGGGEHGPVRQHFVRGHWKVRRTGIFFWHPFRRGRLKHGEVSKDYLVTN